MCKCWLDLHNSKHKETALKKLPGLRADNNNMLDNKKGFPETGGRSALQMCLKRTRELTSDNSLAAVSRRDELIIRLGTFPSKAKPGHN